MNNKGPWGKCLFRYSDTVSGSSVRLLEMAARSDDDDDMDRINQETAANTMVRLSFGQDVDKVMSDRLDSNNEKKTKFFNMKNFQKDKHIDYMSYKKAGKAEKNPNDVKEFKVKKTEREEIARIRFLFFNGKSETSHFHPDFTLEEVVNTLF